MPRVKSNQSSRLPWLAMLFAFFTVAVAIAGTEPRRDYGKIELIRDTWGIPHIFATTDTGAMYGLATRRRMSAGFR